MKATHIVKDASNKTVGFLLNHRFYNNYKIRRHIEVVDNLYISEDNTIKSNKKLPAISYDTVNKLEFNRIIENNPLNRDIQQTLLAWKNNPLHKVLQVSGPRQVGKTTEIEKFAYKNYEHIIYVNLLTATFNFTNTCDNLDMTECCKHANLPYFVNTKQTILIIDEIQTSPKVYNSLSKLHNNLSCDIIVTGSYLGHTLNNKEFIQTETVTQVYMFPLSFKEFCSAFGKTDTPTNLNQYTSEYSQELNSLYDLYKKIGGYPEVVMNFINHKNINNCYEIIQELLNNFERELWLFSSYFKDPQIIKTTLDYAIKDICRGKWFIGNTLENIRELTIDADTMIVSNDETDRAIQWLIYSGVIGEKWLQSNHQTENIRKLYFLDCGLASYISIQANLNEQEQDKFLEDTFEFCEIYRLFKNQAFKEEHIGT